MISIKELRTKAGMTQQELADKLGVQQSSIAMYESGNRVPSTALLPALSKALGCSIDDLFKEAN